MWNYRVIQHPAKDGDEEWWGLHEVYYNDDHSPDGWTETACFIGSDLDDLIETAGLIVQDMMGYEHLVEEDNELHPPVGSSD